MSQFPPPGPPGPPPPGGAPPPGPGVPPPAYGAPPPWGPPVHQPGVVPLRPLTLGDMFGGATLTIRRNPAATVGLAALVKLVFMLVPVVVTLVLGFGDHLPSLDLESNQDSNPMAGIGLNAASLISGVFSALAGIVVTGLVMRAVEQAVVGRRLAAGEAWRTVRGRLWALLGLSLLAGLISILVVGLPAGGGVAVGLLAGSDGLAIGLGILGGLAGLVVIIFVYVRFLLLAPPNLVIERNGVLASMRRAGQLSRGQFWRLLGISLLAGLAAGLVGQLVQVPFAIVGVVLAFLLPGSWGTVALLLCTYVATVVTGSVTSPFTGGVTALQYYDQRFRKEGHDIELLNRSLTQPPDRR
jgi:hypothetical protein